MSLLLSYKIEICSPSYHLLSVGFLNIVVMACYYILQLFPVSACPISLHMYFVIRMCWFVGSSLLLRIFGMLSLQNRLSNSKLHYEILVPSFWLLSFAWDPSISFQSLLLQLLFCLLLPLWNSFVSVVIVIDFLFFGVVQQTLRKLGRCQMTQLI